MTDGLTPWGAITAAVARAVFPSRAKPKLRVTVLARRRGGKTLVVRVKVTNGGDAAVTIDDVSSWVRAKRGRRGIEEVTFSSGPKLPFRLESYSSAEWQTTLKISEQWMAATTGVDCTAWIAGGGASAYKVSKVMDS